MAFFITVGKGTSYQSIINMSNTTGFNLSIQSDDDGEGFARVKLDAYQPHLQGIVKFKVPEGWTEKELIHLTDKTVWMISNYINLHGFANDKTLSFDGLFLEVFDAVKRGDV